MSSTNRGGKREVSDYYQTPEWIIKQFWERFRQLEVIWHDERYSLDPCAGGSETQPMAYPSAIPNLEWHTIDIRKDSRADQISDYLNIIDKRRYQIIISNPPFCLAEEFIRKAMGEVTEDGFVIFLLRLNFLGGQKRKKLFEEFKPKYVFVHSKRPSFTKGQTDSIEYAHFVWQQGFKGNTILEIL